MKRKGTKVIARWQRQVEDMKTAAAVKASANQNNRDCIDNWDNNWPNQWPQEWQNWNVGPFWHNQY